MFNKISNTACMLNRLFQGIIFIFFVGVEFLRHAQTTFTENAATYGPNLNRNEDGGLAWCQL